MFQESWSSSPAAQTTPNAQDAAKKLTKIFVAIVFYPSFNATDAINSGGWAQHQRDNATRLEPVASLAAVQLLKDEMDKHKAQRNHNAIKYLKYQQRIQKEKFFSLVFL